MSISLSPFLPCSLLCSWLALARLEAKVGNIGAARQLFVQSDEKCPNNVHILHAWGHHEQKHGNVDVARDCWSRAVEIDPLNAYVCHALSNLEKRLGNFDRAHEVLQRVVERKPTAAICVSLAELERQLGRPEAARDVLLRGLECVKEEQSKLLLALAWLEEDAFGLTQQAAARVDQALAMEPHNVRVYVAKASLLLRQQKVSEAREVLCLATQMSAEDAQHYTMWGTLELESGDAASARRILQEGAKLYPGDRFLLQRWGTLEAKLGDIPKARELFERSVLIQPHAPTFVAWAILEENEAIAALSRANALSVPPSDEPSAAEVQSLRQLQASASAPATYSHGQSLNVEEFDAPAAVYHTAAEGFTAEQQASASILAQKVQAQVQSRLKEQDAAAGKELARSKFAQSRQLFQVGMEVDPYHGPLYHAFGNWELRRGNVTGAREIFNTGIARNCSDITALYHALGLLEIKCEQRKQAGDIFRKGIELGLKGNREVDPGVGFLLHSLGMLELDNRRFSEAHKVFSTGIRLFPNHSQMLLGQALVCMKLGQHEQARAHFRLSVDADAAHLHAWQCWAIAEKQFGNIELARVLFRQGLKNGPMHGALWQGYAVMEMQQSNSDIARSLFAQAVRRAPTHAQSYQAWACLEVRLGNVLQAKALTWEGIRRAPAHAALWTVAGLVEERLGDAVRAMEVLQMGIDRFPEHGALYRVLGELQGKRGAYAEARALFQEGLRRDPYYAPIYSVAALLEAKLGNLENLSELHRKATTYFAQGSQTRVRGSVGEVSSEEELDESVDIIERIQALEKLSQDSLKAGKSLSEIEFDEQKYGLNSDSFILNLSSH
ncbi:hypothetical protein B484DRAFT_324887 [Ochromonadaceae sp. CCMP2298]|nr:hypothetical protein B484DRAFT_324887 [Ochromonadaceae sp. CCMP2298]